MAQRRHGRSRHVRSKASEFASSVLGRGKRRRARREGAPSGISGRAPATTHSIPIVFVVVPDPVGSGYVKSLSQPGSNATGFMMFEYNLCGKWLELLKEIAPSVTHAAVLRDPAVAAGIVPVRRHPIRGLLTNIDAQQATLIEYYGARNLVICRCRLRASTNSPST